MTDDGAWVVQVRLSDAQVRTYLNPGDEVNLSWTADGDEVGIRGQVLSLDPVPATPRARKLAREDRVHVGGYYSGGRSASEVGPPPKTRGGASQSTASSYLLLADARGRPQVLRRQPRSTWQVFDAFVRAWVEFSSWPLTAPILVPISSLIEKEEVERRDE